MAAIILFYGISQIDKMNNIGEIILNKYGPEILIWKGYAIVINW